MAADDPYTTEAARAAAERGALEDWVGEFLRSPGSDNAALAEQLREQSRTWAGPVQVGIDELHRLAGPPGAPVLEEVEDDEWRDDVDELASSIRDGHEPAPVIVTFRDDQLVLEDGNHRVEALRRSGATQAWAVIGFEDPADLDRFLARREGTS